jgi:hypothetical protein
MRSEREVEAAAMAIHHTFGNRSGRGRKWAELPARLKQQYRDEAKAALDAADLAA